MFETTLDCVRSNKLEPNVEVLKVMSPLRRLLSDLTYAARDGGSVDDGRTKVLVKELEALANGDPLPSSASAERAAKPKAAPAKSPPSRRLQP